MGAITSLLSGLGLAQEPDKKSNKRAIVWTSPSIQRVCEGGIRHKAVMERVSASAVIEDALISYLLPSDLRAARSVSAIYAGLSTIREETAAVLGEEAAGTGWRAQHADEAIKDFLKWVDGGLFLVMSTDLDMESQDRHHAADCWDSVASLMEDEAQTARDRLEAARDRARREGDENPQLWLDLPDLEREARAKKADAMVSRAYWQDLDDGVSRRRPCAYTTYVLQHWDVLGNYTYTWRALSSIVAMSTPQESDTELDGYIKAITKLYEARDE